MGDLTARTYHHPQRVVRMRGGEKMWEKRPTNNWYGMKAGKLEPGKVKQQLGGAPELRGLEEGLWGRWDQVLSEASDENYL